MGRLGGMGPPDDGVDCGLADGILICGLIGLGELGKSDGLVGSAMCEIVRELARMAQRAGYNFSTEHISFYVLGEITVPVLGSLCLPALGHLFHCQINSTIVIYIFHTDVDNLADF
jgi:hypothetical protein